MKNLVSISTIVLIVLSVFSCNPERLTDEYYLTDEMKQEIPFNGFETLRFIADTNKIIEFTSENRINKIGKSYNDHTLSDYIICERDDIFFHNEKYIMSLGMQACISYPNGVGFRFSDLDNDYSCAVGFNQFTENYNILDSLLINGVWLNEIYYDSMNYLQSEPLPSDLQKHPVISYYSKTLGVVRIDFSDSTFWELKEVEW